jgi:hypothetical protein
MKRSLRSIAGRCQAQTIHRDLAFDLTITPKVPARYADTRSTPNTTAYRHDPDNCCQGLRSPISFKEALFLSLWLLFYE